MKKLIALVLSVLTVFSLCACKNDDISNPGMHTTETENQSQGESVKESESGTQQETGALGINQSTVVDDENIPSVGGKLIVTGEKSSEYKSGYSPLPKVSYGDVSEGTDCAVERISHSHGPASGGKVHSSVLEAQKLFDEYGAAAVDTKCDAKVLYLTFDCGYEYDNLTSRILDTLKEKQVPAAFFSTLDHIQKQPETIARMIREGHVVGNHSTTHPDFTTISRKEIVEELETTENYLRENYGYVAKFFRFPTGAYSESTLEVVSDMGYRSIFWSVAYDDWDTENVRGKEYTIDKVMSRLHDGAIILLHGVSRDNADALGDIIDRARAEGYEFRSLTALSF